MEAYERKLIDRKFLDGMDLTWGNAGAVLEMIRKIALRQGIGDLASRGVKALGRPDRRGLGQVRHPLQGA